MKKIITTIVLACSLGANAGLNTVPTFTGTNGQYTQGSLITDGTYLYGMPPSGGASKVGLVFSSSTPGAALNFDGVNNYVASDSLISHGNQFTYEAWIMTTSPHDWGGIVTTSTTGGQPQWVQFTLASSGRLRVEVVDDASNNKWYEGTNTLINDGNWHHVATTYDGNNNLILYVDGIVQSLSKINDATLGAITVKSTLYVGAERGLGAYYVGSIDEVRIWSRALCQSEIVNSMNGELNLPQTSLLVYYNFNEGISNSPNPTVTTLADSSGNGYNGTLKNFALTGTTSNWIAPGAIATGIYSPAVITINSPTICAGATATLTANSSIATSYTWSTTDTTASITATPPLTTNYTVTGKDAHNCLVFATSTVTVNSLPNITVNSGSVCEGSSFTMTPSGANTYTYSSGSAVVTPTANASYTVTGTNTVTTCSNKAISTVTVNATPMVTVNSPTICAGATATLTANNGTATSYTWNTTDTTASITATPTLTTNYTVTGKDAHNCLASATSTVTVNSLPNITVNNGSVCEGSSFTMTPSGANSYTYSSGSAVVTPTTNASYTVTGTNTVTTCSNKAISTVTVNATPTVTVNSPTICAGTTTTLTANSGTATSYAWNTTAITASITATPTLTTNYTVTATDTHNCIAFATSTVTVNSLPNITINSGSVCEGSSFTMTPSGANTYTYSSGSAVVTPTANASYTVTGTNTVTTCSNKAISTVTVNALPMVTASSNTVSLCVGHTATLTASGATTYTWNTAATTIAIAVSPTVTTTYTVTGASAAGCHNMTTITQSVSTCGVGIEQYSAVSNEVTVYPNPNNGNFIITTTENTKTILVTDILGNELISINPNGKTTNVNLSAQPSGVYFIKVISGNAQTVKRIIVYN